MFEKRPVDPGAVKTLDSVVATTEALRTAQARRSRHAKVGARAIAQASGWRVSLVDTTVRQGTRASGVRQMGTQEVT